ncbi:type IV secretion system DNA-binding domain-containing protein [Dechloromonas agitata]|uniref:type IV secretion system DNA-binding domain-containing protein n=1 Tax=Dechloromonas agitata TaxID=73030 RepID=UPI00237D5F46|nr:type IV secretion system DNA-binding domain-containing protein [Dechloromonas agitata]MDE1545721.1 type IV secretion system DNA-binding domain-containing protein [Dechloromonas agitata]
MQFLGKLVGRALGFVFMLPAIALNKAGFYNLSFPIRYAVYAILGIMVGWGSTETMLGIAIGFAVVTELAGFALNRSDADDEHLRGNQLVDVKTVQKMMKGEDCRFNLGEVPFPKKFETRHILLAGTTGSGKTRVMHQILLPTRNTEGARAIIVDIGAAMVSRYYQGEGSMDVILNPRDARSVAWSPLAEINDLDDIPLISSAIIPDGVGSGAEWQKYAQRLMAGVLQRVWEQGGDNAEVIRLLTRAPVEELRDLLAGLPAEGMLREGNEKMLASVMAIITTYTTPLAALDPSAGADSFSVTRWVMADAVKGWLFMNFSDRQIEQLKPIITTILSVAISATLSLKEDPNRRLFFVIDEADALGEISGLRSLLTRGRRFGAAAVLAIQSVSQLYTCYGRDTANTLLSNLGTQVILRLPDAETAEWASRTFGDEQIREEQTSSSRGLGLDGKESISTSYQTRQQRVVLPSEIQNLPDLVALLNVVGDCPPCAVQIPPVNPPQVHPEFVRREA